MGTALATMVMAAASNGKASAEARAENAALRARLEWVEGELELADRYVFRGGVVRDYACAGCVPTSEVAKTTGFTCAYHKAKQRLAERAAPAQEGGK